MLGGVGALGFLERMARRPGLLVLGYHRIGTPADAAGYPGVFSANAEDFRTQIRHLHRCFRVLSLDDVIASAPDFSFREPCVLITFDDGYRDNCDVALPILRELNVAATFFLTTDFFDRPHLFWWDRLFFIIQRTKIDHIMIDEPMPINFDLNVITRDAAIAQAVHILLNAEPDTIDPWLDRLEQCAEVQVADADLACSLLMGWDGARELLAGGMSVGSHARSHRNLARLDEASQREELVKSKSRLEAELGRSADALAYPYGVSTAFTSTTCRLAQEAGYKLAFGFGGGINRPGRSAEFSLARINVGYADTFPLFRARAALLSAFDKSVL